MTRLELLLLQLSEECDETGQRASKAIRFSLNEIQKGQTKTNAERIIYEFNDIFAVMEVLKEEGAIDRIIDRDMIEEKKIKIEKWLQHSKEQGVLK